MAILNARDNEFYGRGVNLAVISIVFTSAAACLVVSRLASRLTTGRKLGPDDYAIVASLVFSIGVGISNCIAVEYGSGKRSIDLSPHDLHIALQITYKFTINLTKTSICLLYLRIFSTEDKARFRRTVYIVMAYVLLYAVASIIGTIFECTPVPRIWNKTIPGTCINLTAFWYANAAANMLGDIWSNSPSRRTYISPPAANNGWYGTQVNKQPSMAILSGSTATANGGPGRKSIDASSDNTFGMDYQDLPMGHITKTTCVNVQYADERCLPALSPNSKEHTRSVSNLVGQDFSFP
ncbi:hypothetical protein OEA41_001427 [Lepraria neglecta]|uniref:Rhodopsin domain-containing protein n=1 Tax=Lepraria neglecta TaxID=209136 RepID=A0AAE0DP09_9LECA|nr:hypothetical protein OEA41_001427 [Lepraria neglecta]